MRQVISELVVGIFIIIVVLALIFLCIKVSGLGSSTSGSTYTVTASFDNVGDLKARAPVTIAGVRIGQVENIALNPKTFQAVVTMQISVKDSNIPVDSTVNIYTEGLLGSNYISLTPGYSNENLKKGSVLENTNSALILQNLIGQLLFSLKGGDDDKEAASKPTGKSGDAVSGMSTNLNLGG